MVIDESEIRSRFRAHSQDGGERVLHLRKGDIVTPSARDFLNSHGYRVEYATADTTNAASQETVHQKTDYQEMSQTLPSRSNSRRYVDLHGVEYMEKPEHMTHLHGDVLVRKNHPRIVFRGKLDSLEAKMLEAQIAAEDDGRIGVIRDLQEILDFTRDILACEVKETPFARQTLLGMDAAKLRAVSHNPREHYGMKHKVPDYRMGRTTIALNAVRTYVREAELAAMSAFETEDGTILRPDLLCMLNRLSSGVYIMICRMLGGYYGRGVNGE